MKQSKKLLSALLSICMLLSITAGVDVSAFAKTYTGSCGAFSDNVKYSFNEDTGVLTISGSGEMHNYGWNGKGYDYRPWGYESDEVGSFSNRIKSIVIKNGVTSIGSNAFSECYNLTSVKISDSVKYIGDYAFYWCYKLDNIVIPDSVVSIGVQAFEQTGYYDNSSHWKNGLLYINHSLVAMNFDAIVKKCIVKDGTICIADRLFENCPKITNITIPKSVKNIGKNAFYNCSNLKFVFYGGTKEKWSELKKNTKITYSYIHYNQTAQTHSYKLIKTVKATPTKNGSQQFRCQCGYGYTKTIYAPKKVILSKTRYVYNGKTRIPDVSVKNTKSQKISSNSYSITYPSGMREVGRYAIKVRFSSDKYSGTVTKTYDIIPKGSSFVSVKTPKKKSIALEWNTVKSISGYQIQVATNSKFTNNSVTYTAGSKSKTASLGNNIISGKKYYLRIRTYKVVKYAGKDVRIYSNWSATKSITVK